MTFCAYVKAVAGAATIGAAGVYVSGAGLPYNNYAQAMVGSGWQLITQTFCPQAAGTLLIGVSAYHLTEVLIDACALRFGDVGMPG
jgi:hypothetical protein